MFSIIIPLDKNRLQQFKKTKRAYDVMPQKKEFVILTRSQKSLRQFFAKHNLDKDTRIIPYTVKTGFNCSKALNLGVRAAKFGSVIITSPEVMPITPVLSQLEPLIGQNVICQVWDEGEDGEITQSLVNSRYRSQTPGMYFLAMFNKKDIKKINGWDEEFMKGYAYEDKDFGSRWHRAGIPFIVRDDIQGRHQYHLRKETVPGGVAINRETMLANERNAVIKCWNGLTKFKPKTR